MSSRDFRSVHAASVLNGPLVLFMEGSEEAAIEKKQSIKKKKKKERKKAVLAQMPGKKCLAGKALHQ